MITPKALHFSSLIEKASRLIGALFFCLALTSTSSAQLPPDDSEDTAFTFAAYNIKNYLGMNRWVDGERVFSGKPEDEINALVRVIVEINPDILGICEIGSGRDLTDLQKRLKRAGIDLPHTEYTHGADEVRRLALLSRYPITATDSQTDSSYFLNAEPWVISRGILDATVNTPIGAVRFIGAHLKSKRQIEAADEAVIRLNEARLMRSHIKDILEKAPETKVMVYGDLNDTRRTDPIKAVIGRKNSKTGLDIIPIADEDGVTWTHHWGYQDIYSRIDWVFTSSALTPFIDKKGSFIPIGKDVTLASDHRPTVVPVLKKARK